jgi:arginase
MRSLIVGFCFLLASCAPDSPSVSDQPTESSREQSTIDSSRYLSEDGNLRISLVKQPYHGGRNMAELSRNPDYLDEGGIHETLSESGHIMKATETVALTREEAREYGEWHRMGLANGHLAEMVAANEEEGFFSVGLLANCNALMGMLGGFQDSRSSEGPQRVGLLWVDAHGDFNTPETTLSGMLGGMPVAVSAGLALNRLRTESHLDPPILTEDIVMVAVRDTDPEEQELIEAHDLVVLSTQDVRDVSEALHAEMRRLSNSTDLIYVHIDMDVLDPREVQGHGLTVPDGPTSQELAAALTEIFRYPRVAGLGIASTPAYEADPGELSRQAAYRLIQGAVEGVKAR